MSPGMLVFLKASQMRLANPLNLPVPKNVAMAPARFAFLIACHCVRGGNTEGDEDLIALVNRCQEASRIAANIASIGACAGWQHHARRGERAYCIA
jgi:hypothetical protein